MGIEFIKEIIFNADAIEFTNAAFLTTNPSNTQCLPFRVTLNIYTPFPWALH